MLQTEIKLLLASNSPRRRQLLDQAGLNFRVFTREVKEEYPPSLRTEDVPEFLARLKASSVEMDARQDEIIVAADTVVVLKGKILGKPMDLNAARTTLKRLSGETHEVITGVCVKQSDTILSFSEVTQVQFNQLSEAQIDYYVQTFKPLDKAGSYAIQEWIGLVGVKEISGCYFNVMGLPVSRLMKELEKIC